MAATFPGGVKSFSTKQPGGAILSTHVNELQEEVVAVETLLLNPSQWGVWKSWSPTCTGWSSQTTIAFYTVVGKIVFFIIYQSAGTSNGTVAKISLPVAAAGAEAKGGACTWVMDNGVVKTGACRWWIAGVATELEIFTDMSSGAWTNSGTKRVMLSGFYRI